MNLSKKLLILCFCVSNLSFSNSNPPLEAVACWSCITSDISGGYLGVQVGAVGGPLGSMALGVIGAVGWSLSSYHDQHGLVVNNGNPTIITESNKYDIVGELHNQILAKLIAKKIKPNDYDSIIQVSLIEIKKNSRFIELKDDVNFIANSRNVLNQYSKDAKVLDVDILPPKIRTTS